ncbi:switch-associated protein 70-like [Gossypium australe]|uniref:Switch-associated protein 70-like n=1 Tax=Gossypium australe TaxID=47621 RepID=A0A5B6VTJ0_9ROSI|nr:switch-associated protein 70-like [Gossypium australe]
MGEAVVQIREVADHLQALAARADALSLMYESGSDRGQSLAWLLRKVKDLGTKAKSYIYDITNLESHHPYRTRLRTRAMDVELNERIERMERTQKELQEQLAKAQQEARDQMMRSREESREHKDQMDRMLKMLTAMSNGQGLAQSPDITEPHSRDNQDRSIPQIHATSRSCNAKGISSREPSRPGATTRPTYPSGGRYIRIKRWG